MNGLAGWRELWPSSPTWLFPLLTDALGEPAAPHREFIAGCEVGAPRAHLTA